MTEVIDLATLASLGQHFSTVEESAEVKAKLISVQEELAVIKSFLFDLYGNKFSNVLNGKNGIQPVEDVKVQESKTTISTNSTAKLVSSSAGSTSAAKQVIRKPPPLQRFGSSNGVQVQSQPGFKREPQAGAGREMNFGKKTKFHRNFLTISSAKKVPSPQGRNGLAVMTPEVAGSLSISKLETGSKDKGKVNLKVERMNYGMNGRAQFQSKYEDAANIEDDGNYDDTGIPVVEDYEYYAPQYKQERQDNVGDEYEEMENSQVEYQEDDTIYEEGYEENDYEMDGDNNSIQLPGACPSLIITAQPAPKKAINQSLSYIGDPSNQGGNDADFKKCKLCHEDIPSISLFQHVIDLHYHGEIPTCHICKKTFTYRQGLISHMRYHDAGKYDKACSYCGKRFIRKSDVAIHEMRLHTGERPYQCPVPDCHQGFVRRYCLLTHIKTNHGEPYLSQMMESAARRKSS